MSDDFIVGHEPMGIVEEVGKDVTRVKNGDRPCHHPFQCSLRPMLVLQSSA